MKAYALFPRTPGLFSSLNVQKNMLQDAQRTSKFREAVFRCVKAGDIVIDLGTGTGILAIWAAQAGARRVYAIEEMDVAEVAREVIERNGFGETITVLRANSSEVTLPEPADVLIAELVGHFLFEEGMVEAVAGVRQVLLKPGATVIPSRARVFLAPAEMRDDFTEVSFWDTWKEPDLSVIRSMAADSAYVERLAPEQLLAEPAEVFDVDFRSAGPQNFSASARFRCGRGGRLDALAGWFTLSLGGGVTLGTGPWDAPTHWQQCVFPLERPCPVRAGDMVECSISIEPFVPGCQWRWEVSAAGLRESHECSITYGQGSRLLKERF